MGKFYLDGERYEVPDDSVSIFLQQYPMAMEAVEYLMPVENDVETYWIPKDQEDIFKNKYPEAQVAVPLGASAGIETEMPPEEPSPVDPKDYFAKRPPYALTDPDTGQVVATSGPYKDPSLNTQYNQIKSTMPGYDLSKPTVGGYGVDVQMPQHEIKQAPKPGWWDGIKGAIKSLFEADTGERQAKVDIVNAMHEETGLPRSFLYENYDDWIRDPSMTGIRGEEKGMGALGVEIPLTPEMVQDAFTGAIITGFAVAPGATALGLGAFMAMDEAEHSLISALDEDPYYFGYFGLTGRRLKNISDFLPEDADKATKNTVEFLDLLVKGALIGGLRKAPAKGKALFEKATKELLKEYGAPRTIVLNPRKMRSIFSERPYTGTERKPKGGEGEMATPEEIRIYKDLDIGHREVVRAIKEGLTIEISADKIVRMVDKPWWGKVKKAFGVEPTDKIISQETGEVTGFGFGAKEPIPIRPKAPTPMKALPGEVGVPLKVVPEEKEPIPTEPLQLQGKTVEEKRKILEKGDLFTPEEVDAILTDVSGDKPKVDKPKDDGLPRGLIISEEGAGKLLLKEGKSRLVDYFKELDVDNEAIYELVDEVKGITDIGLDDVKVAEAIDHSGKDLDPESAEIMGQNQEDILDGIVVDTMKTMKSGDPGTVIHERTEVFYERTTDKVRKEIGEERDKYHERTGSEKGTESDKEWFANFATDYSHTGEGARGFSPRLRRILDKFREYAKRLAKRVKLLEKYLSEGKVSQRLKDLVRKAAGERLPKKVQPEWALELRKQAKKPKKGKQLRMPGFELKGKTNKQILDKAIKLAAKEGVSLNHMVERNITDPQTLINELGKEIKKIRELKKKPIEELLKMAGYKPPYVKTGISSKQLIQEILYPVEKAPLGERLGYTEHHKEIQKGLMKDPKDFEDQFIRYLSKKFGMSPEQIVKSDNPVYKELGIEAFKMWDRGEIKTIKDFDKVLGIREPSFELKEIDVKNVQKGLKLSPGKIKRIAEDLAITDKDLTAFKAKKTIDIGKLLTDRAIEIGKKYGVDLAKNTPEVLEILAQTIYIETQHELALGEQGQFTGLGFYSTKMQNAGKVMSLLQPKIGTDPIDSGLFKFALAITSNGTAIPENLSLALENYEFWLEHGKLNEKIKNGGMENETIQKTFKKFNEVVDKNGLDAVLNFMVTRFRAGYLRDKHGFKISPAGVNDIIPGAFIFGPKVGGGFYMNLQGLYQYLTQDRWFMRGIGRKRGNLAIDQQLAYPTTIDYNKPTYIRSLGKSIAPLQRFKDSIEGTPARYKYGLYKKDFKDDIKVIEAAKKIERVYAKGGYNDKSELNLSANNLVKNLEKEYLAPRPADRRFNDKVMVRAAELSGITVADNQAVTWFPQKRLHAELGIEATKAIQETDYEQEAIKIVKERLGTSDRAINKRISQPDKPELSRYGEQSHSGQYKLREPSFELKEIEGKHDPEKIKKESGLTEQEKAEEKEFVDALAGQEIPEYSLLTKVWNKLTKDPYDWLLTYGKARREDRELFDALMRAKGKRNAGIEQAIQEIKDVLGGRKMDVDTAAEVSLMRNDSAYRDKKLAEDPEIGEYFYPFDRLLDAYEKAVKEHTYYKGDLKQRLIGELQKELDNIKTTEKRKKEIPGEIEKIKRSKYLPQSVVVQKAIEYKYGNIKKPTARRKFVAQVLSGSYTKRTSTKLLDYYFRKGILDKNDIDIRRLAAEMIDGFYYRSSVTDILKVAEQRGMVKDYSKELDMLGWYTPSDIGGLPELKGKILHPLLGESFLEYRDELVPSGSNPLFRFMSMQKLGQFIKPSIIWLYDTIQMGMGGMYSLNPVTNIKNLSLAFDIVMFNKPLYHELNKLNLFQFPYEVPRKAKQQALDELIHLTDKNKNTYIEHLKNFTGIRFSKKGDGNVTPYLKIKNTAEFWGRLFWSPFEVLGKMAWFGDKIIRTWSVLNLKDFGYSNNDAVKTASRYHGAYSELSKRYKKTFSPLFFVHSFRVLMPRQMVRMATDMYPAILERMQMDEVRRLYESGEFDKLPPKDRKIIEDNWSEDPNTGEWKPNWDDIRRRYNSEIIRAAKALGFLAIVGSGLLLDEIMVKYKGFKRDKYGWKYVKKGKDPTTDEDVEVVVAVNYILNMPFKWWHRFMDDDPTDLHFMAPISRVLQWEVHPLLRMLTYDISQNQRAFGSGRIFNPGDNTGDGKIDWKDKIIQAKDAFTYILLESFRFWGELDRAVDEDIMSKMERHRQHEIINDSMPLMERMIFKNIGYVYARKNLTLRKTWKYSQIDKIYNDQTAYAISQVSQLSVLKNKPGLSDSEKKEITTELKKHQKDIATWTNWMTAAHKWVETSMK